MPIQRDFLEGEGTPPILFRVSDTFEVWDGQVALVIDHLLNHLKVLTDLAEGPADQAVVDILANHPHYQIDRRGQVTDATRDAVAKTLIDECTALLKCLATIAPIMRIDQADRSQILEITQEQVPFLDYHYVDAAYISDAQRED